MISAQHLFRLNAFLILLVGVSAVSCSTPYLNQTYRERVTEEFKGRVDEKISLRATRTFITCSGVETDLPHPALFKKGFQDCKQQTEVGDEQGIFLNVEYPEVVFVGDEAVVRITIDRLEKPKSREIKVVVRSNADGVRVQPANYQKLKVRETEYTDFILTTMSDAGIGDKILSFSVSSDLGRQSNQLRYAISQPPTLFSLSQEEFKVIAQLSQIIGLPALLLLIVKALVDWRKPKTPPKEDN